VPLVTTWTWPEPVPDSEMEADDGGTTTPKRRPTLVRSATTTLPLDFGSSATRLPVAMGWWWQSLGTSSPSAGALKKSPKPGYYQQRGSLAQVHDPVSILKKITSYIAYDYSSRYTAQLGIEQWHDR
jgi:hypothetical protein